jgi:hypothetical protein
MFRMLPHRWPQRLLLALLSLGWIAFIAVGLYRAETNIEDFFPWLPDDTPARNNYMEFIREFGADDTLIVSWEGCHLGDPRVERLRRLLPVEEARWIRGVTTADSLLQQLTGPPQKFSHTEAVRRLTHVLIGTDGETTCLFVHLNNDGMRDRRRSVSRVIAHAERACGIAPDDLRLAGHPYVGYYSAEQTRTGIIWLSIPVAIVSTLLAWLCLRRKRLMFVVLTCGGLAALTSLAMVPWAGYRVNGLLSALPSLVFVITTSGVIHVVNYSLAIRREDREAGRSPSPSEHAAEVRRRAGVACLLSSVSNVIGTVSLIWNDFPAIREFGIFGTAAAVVTLGIHLGLLPTLLARVFPDDAATVPPDQFARPFGRMFDIMLRYRRPIVVGAIGLALLLAWPLFNLQGKFTLDRMYRPESDFVRNIRWIESQIGAIDATEILLRFEGVDSAGFFRRIRRVQELEAAVAAAPHVQSTFSTVTLLPHLPDHWDYSDVVLMRHALERRRSSLLGGSHLVQDGESEVWRITARSLLFGGQTREELMRGLRQAVASETADWETPPQVVYTGGSEIFYETQHDVLIGFAQSLLLAYAQIFLMMLIALRSLRAGLLSMFPNIFPCLTVFGLLGWIDGGIDIGMTVAGCIALGVAVDNTAHLLLSYRAELRELGDREAALRSTYRHSSTAVFQTSLICGLSMLPYAFSEMQYLSRFGLLIAVLMFAANTCDLLLTPALIMGRFGRVFDGRRVDPHRSATLATGVVDRGTIDRTP